MWCFYCKLQHPYYALFLIVNNSEMNATSCYGITPSKTSCLSEDAFGITQTYFHSLYLFCCWSTTRNYAFGGVWNFSLVFLRPQMRNLLLLDCYLIRRRAGNCRGKRTERKLVMIGPIHAGCIDRGRRLLVRINPIPFFSFCLLVFHN